jgi:4-amino-4-deoxy-L-arabinose transferase
MKFSKKYFFWGLLFFIIAYLIPIAGRPLMRPDEFRYGEIPREMRESGDFVTPRLLQARYFEKPVLGYWLTAGSFKIFGINRFSLRLPMALATGLTALLIALWIKRSSGDAEWALWAGLFYATTGLVWVLGTTAVLDSILALFTTATLICVHQAVAAPKWNFERLVWLVLCGVTAGLGFMTKGFIAWAAPGTAAVAYLLWTKRWKALLWLPWIPLLSLAATIAPWAWEIHRAEPDFWHYFVVVEHFQRFKSDTDQHPEPFWFYVPVMLGTLFPAMLSVLHAAAAGKDAWRKTWRDDLWRFALCAVVLPFCFFSASKGKLATYILPCFPFAAAALTFPALEALRAGRREALLTLRWIFDILGWVLLVFGAAAIAFGLALLPPVSLRRFIPALAKATPMFMLIGISSAAAGAWQIRRRGSPRSRIAGFFGFFALIMGSLAAMPNFDSEKMPERDLLALRESGEFDPLDAIIFTYGQMGHAVAWTFDRSDTRLLFSPGEMEYGAINARRDGVPLWWSHDGKNEFAKLIRDPARRRPVVYIALIDEDQKHRYKILQKLKPRRVDRGIIMALIYDPVTSKRAPKRAVPKSASPAPRVR